MGSGGRHGGLDRRGHRAAHGPTVAAGRLWCWQPSSTRRSTSSRATPCSCWLPSSAGFTGGGCTPLVAGSRRSWFRMPSGMPLCCSGSPSKQPPRSPSGPHPNPRATDPVSTAGALHSANFDAKGGSGWVATDPVHCRGAPPLGAGHLPPRSPTTARKTPGADCRPLSLDAPPAAASGPSPLPAAPTQRRGYCRSHQCGALPPGTYASSGHAQPRGLPAAPWHSARGGRSTRRHTEGRTKRTLLQADTRRSGACDGNTRRGRASSSRVVRGQRRGAMRRPFRGPEWRGQQADVRGPNEDQQVTQA